MAEAKEASPELIQEWIEAVLGKTFGIILQGNNELIFDQKRSWTAACWTMPRMD